MANDNEAQKKEDQQTEEALRADRDDALGYSREVISNEESQDIQVEEKEQKPE
jgi:hypothetical protein